MPMIAVIFEVWPKPEHRQTYFDLAANLQPNLQTIDGFISVERFQTLHESGCFILPNPFDVGSAKALQHLGFKALASSSAGFAWTIGKVDNHVTVDDVCQHLAALCSAVDIPVNADFEGGFAVEPDKVGEHVERGVRTGIAGL